MNKQELVPPQESAEAKKKHLVVFISDRSATHLPSSAYGREYPSTVIQQAENNLDLRDLQKLRDASLTHILAVVAIETSRFSQQATTEALSYLEGYSIPIIFWSAAEQETGNLGERYQALFQRIRQSLNGSKA